MGRNHRLACSSSLNMRQSIIAWLCIFAMACGATNLHEAERADNAAHGTTHQIDLEKCLNGAIATFHTTQDHDKADVEYKACADKADKAAGMK